MADETNEDLVRRLKMLKALARADDYLVVAVRYNKDGSSDMEIGVCGCVGCLLSGASNVSDQIADGIASIVDHTDTPTYTPKTTH